MTEDTAAPSNGEKVCFVIMPIGDPRLDEMYVTVYIPTIESAGLVPKRVDLDGEGDTLINEIVKFIQEAAVVIADLTNERPNCYLEVGYTLGAGRHRNLILCCRADHHHSHKDYNRDGPKVHFDISGYHLNFWEPDDLDGFVDDLSMQIRRVLKRTEVREHLARDVELNIVEQRLADKVGESPQVPGLVETQEVKSWMDRHRSSAASGASETGISAQIEFSCVPEGQVPSVESSALVSSAQSATIHSFGWPIGVVMTRDEYRPRPDVDGGVRAEIAISDEDTPSYDYWAISPSGWYYFLQSLFEDKRIPNSVFFDTRILRTAETLMFFQRLYANLGFDPSATDLRVSFRMTGLKGRVLRSAARDLFYDERSIQHDEYERQIVIKMDEVRTNLVEHVKSLLGGLFFLFDFFEPDESVWEHWIGKFLTQSKL